MKRDMNLIRKIMLQVEARPSVNDWDLVEIDGRAQEEISYHVWLLSEAGMVEALDHCGLGPNGFCYVPKYLTIQGHDFLDSIRDDSVWKKVKQALAVIGGSGSLEVVKAVAKAVTMKVVMGALDASSSPSPPA